MRIPQHESTFAAHSRSWQRCGSVRYTTILPIVVMSVLLTSFAKPERALAAPHLKRMLIVVPEEPTGAEFEETVLIPNPDDTGELIARWIFKGEKIDQPPLEPINEDGQRETKSGNLSIQKQVTDRWASYELDADDGEIKEFGPIKMKLVNANRLMPGVYRGISQFQIKLSRKDVAVGGTDPEPFDYALEITVVKCGRRLHNVRLWNDGDSAEIAFGRPWRVTAEYDEFTGSKAPLVESRELLQAPDLQALKMQIEVNLTLKKSKEPVRLAQVTVTRNGFEPPLNAPKNWEELWKDVFFDAVALQEQNRSSTPDPVDGFLYNSRISVSGLGPQTWVDPVAWLTSKNALPQSLSLPEYGDDRGNSKAFWKRGTTEIGFPAMDLLGELSTEVTLIETGTSSDARPSIDRKSIAAGFAVFPQVSVLNEPVQIIAGVRQPCSGLTFRIQHEAQGGDFTIDLSPDSPSTGDGIRFSGMSSNGEPCGCAFFTEGRWSVTPNSTSVESFQQTNFQAIAGIVNPPPPTLLIFPTGKPYIFNLPLNNAASEEYANGSIIPPTGTKTRANNAVIISVIPGLADAMKCVPLPPSHIAPSAGGYVRYETSGQPVCELIDSSGTKITDLSDGPTTDLKYSFQMMHSPLRYDLLARFGAENNGLTPQPEDLPVLVTPSPPETPQDIEFLIPFVIHTRIGEDESAQITFNRFTVRVRSDKDYWLHKLLYGSVCGGSLLIIAGTIVAIIRQQLSQRAELLAEIEQQSHETAHSQPTAAETELPQSRTIEPPQLAEPDDDSPAIL